MFKSKNKIAVLTLATLSLLAVTAVGFAQRHHLIAAIARPDVKVQLSAAVERDSELVPLDKASVVRPGEVLDWTIVSENNGNAVAHNYKAVARIPRGTEFIAGTAKAEGAKA